MYLSYLYFYWKKAGKSKKSRKKDPKIAQKCQKMTKKDTIYPSNDANKKVSRKWQKIRPRISLLTGLFCQKHQKNDKKCKKWPKFEKSLVREQIRVQKKSKKRGTFSPIFVILGFAADSLFSDLNRDQKNRWKSWVKKKKTEKVQKKWKKSKIAKIALGEVLRRYQKRPTLL